MKKQCSNCEFNINGICAGNSDIYKYGEPIIDDTKYCQSWGASFEYFNYETNNAPRFLRESFNDCSISYDELSKRVEAYSEGRDIPINIFDAIKFIYGLSMVDIAVLMNISFGTVYNAKIRGIPLKRINQFSEFLCIPTEVLLKNDTSVFPLLEQGKEILLKNSEFQEKVNSLPEWKQHLTNIIASVYLNCPIHYAKIFARVDKFYWTNEMQMDDFTDSEKQLINYVRKHSGIHQQITRIEYSLDRACQPHIDIESNRL